MTTEYFIKLRIEELRSFLRARFGRRWRYRVARRLGRKDAPRWLVTKKYPATLTKILLVERLAIELGYRLGCPRSAMYRRRCPLDDYSGSATLPEAEPEASQVEAQEMDCR